MNIKNISVYKIVGGEKQKIDNYTIQNKSDGNLSLILNGVSGNIDIEYSLPAPKKKKKSFLII